MVRIYYLLNVLEVGRAFLSGGLMLSTDFLCLMDSFLVFTDQDTVRKTNNY